VIFNDYRNKAVLITGGTAGIGLATGLAFARHGARVYLTHRWASADEQAIKSRFEDEGCPEPVILEADASSREDTLNLIREIRKSHASIEAFISNVSFGHISKSPRDLDRRSLLISLKYSTWPILDYLKTIKAEMGKYPRYAVAMSSKGPDSYHFGYDFIAASKIALEILCRQLTAALIHEDIRINALAPNPVFTQSFEATFGPDFKPYLETQLGQYGRWYIILPEEVARAALALCGGGMDAMKGQVLKLDRGCCFSESLYRIYAFNTGKCD